MDSSVQVAIWGGLFAVLSVAVSTGGAIYAAWRLRRETAQRQRAETLAQAETARVVVLEKGLEALNATHERQQHDQERLDSQQQAFVDMYRAEIVRLRGVIEKLETRLHEGG